MSKILIVASAAIFIVLGVLHGLLTLRGNALTPRDEHLKYAMQGAHLRLDRSINLWDAWIGFNLSHSLALILFGGGLMWLAVAHYPALMRNGPLQVVATCFVAVYLGLSLRYWFRLPTVCLGLVLICLIGAFVMQALSGPADAPLA